MIHTFIKKHWILGALLAGFMLVGTTAQAMSHLAHCTGTGEAQQCDDVDDPLDCFGYTGAHLSTAIGNYNTNSQCKSFYRILDRARNYPLTVTINSTINVTNQETATNLDTGQATYYRLSDGTSKRGGIHITAYNSTENNASNYKDRDAVTIDATAVHNCVFKFTHKTRHQMSYLSIKVLENDSVFCDADGRNLKIEDLRDASKPDSDYVYVWGTSVRIIRVDAAGNEIALDTDGDGVADNVPDNCPSAENATQTDSDHDGVGDACDGTPGTPGGGGGGTTAECTSFEVTPADGQVVVEWVTTLTGVSSIQIHESTGDMIDVPATDIASSGQTTFEAPEASESDRTISYSATLTAGGTTLDCPLRSILISGTGSGGGGGGGGIPDPGDNCPDDATADQTDTDGDGLGDACDDSPITEDDRDGDGVDNDLEEANGTNPDDPDTDDDGLGDGQERPFAGYSDPLLPDTDEDGICDGPKDIEGTCTSFNGLGDNCPVAANPDQADEVNENGDPVANGVGDICEFDVDADGVADHEDNCPATPNPDQTDSDGDGNGDACQPSGSGSDSDGGGCGCVIGGTYKARPVDLIPYLMLGLPLAGLVLRRRRLPR